MNMMPVIDRTLVFDGCFNWRDLGGYSTESGATVLSRRLHRGDGPHALSDADRLRLSDLRLASVIDLRTADEVVQRGRYGSVLSGVVEYHVPMLDALADLGDLSLWSNPYVVAERYREMLHEGLDALAEVLAILSDPSSYPTVVHCSAGKDRTGIVSAVLLGLLGVADDAIISDYALSGAAMLRLLEHLRRVYPDASDWLERAAPALVSAEPATMIQFLTDLRADFGSFDGLADAIGVGSTAHYLRIALLDPAASAGRSAAVERDGHATCAPS